MEYMTLDDITKYKSVFKTPPPINSIGGFDVGKFDDILHQQHGYTEEEHGSIIDFLTLKYGEKFCNFICYSLANKYFNSYVGTANAHNS